MVALVRGALLLSASLATATAATSSLRIGKGTDEEVRKVCRELVPGWGDGVELALKPLKGGITNLLWRVDAQPASWCAEADRTCSVLVRRYGDNTELLIDRTRETAVLQALSHAGFDVALVAAFSNGRVEKWLEGWSAFTMEQMHHPAVSAAVAGQVARLHDTRPNNVKGISPQQPALWRQLESWLGMALNVTFDDKAKSAGLAALDLKGLGEHVLPELKHVRTCPPPYPKILRFRSVKVALCAGRITSASRPT